jgi:hypothetical protein
MKIKSYNGTGIPPLSDGGALHSPTKENAGVLNNIIN